MYGKLVDNFMHESDVTSLQDLFTSRPSSRHVPKDSFLFYYSILFHIKREETILFQIHAKFSSILDYLVLCL